MSVSARSDHATQCFPSCAASRAGATLKYCITPQRRGEPRTERRVPALIDSTTHSGRTTGVGLPLPNCLTFWSVRLEQMMWVTVLRE